MYSKILSGINSGYYQQKYSNDGQRFIAWYLRNIHNLDEIQTKDCITDGSNDKHIDAIHVDDESCKVYIIQGKFIGSNKVDAEPLREVLASWVHIKDLQNLQNAANPQLKRKLIDLGDAINDGYDLSFELITTAGLSDAAKVDLQSFQNEIAEYSDISANFTLVDNDELMRRYELSLGSDNPMLTHKITLVDNKFLYLDIGKTKAVLAAIPLKDCLRFPGIKNGTLFKKNVRQSLGTNNTVNKGIAQTIKNNASDFFFYHNGITAICSELTMKSNELSLKGLNVVNGCQSLNTILSCSETVKEIDDAYIMFRFYEIPDYERADKISTATNSQSAVKARDLRSNDKRVLALKKAYEQQYTNGYMKTKRGEQKPANKDSDFIVDLSDLGKYLMSWHSQRPNIAYSEAKIFDKYFEQLFKKDYNPNNIHTLNQLSNEVLKRWTKDNPLGLNESLLAMKSYAPNHHMYAISICFCVVSNMPEGVPDPYTTIEQAKKQGMLDSIIDMAGVCLNSALEAAANEPLPVNRVFSPQNWIKTKTCLVGIRAAIRQYINMLPAIPNMKDVAKNYQTALHLEPGSFSERWSAD